MRRRGKLGNLLLSSIMIKAVFQYLLLVTTLIITQYLEVKFIERSNLKFPPFAFCER